MVLCSTVNVKMFYVVNNIILAYSSDVIITSLTTPAMLLQNHSKLSPAIYMTIYKSTNLQSVNIKSLKSSKRSNKLMFVYLLNDD